MVDNVIQWYNDQRLQHYHNKQRFWLKMKLSKLKHEPKAQSSKIMWSHSNIGLASQVGKIDILVSNVIIYYCYTYSHSTLHPLRTPIATKNIHFHFHSSAWWVSDLAHSFHAYHRLHHEDHFLTFILISWYYRLDYCFWYL